MTAPAMTAPLRFLSIASLVALCTVAAPALAQTNPKGTAPAPTVSTPLVIPPQYVIGADDVMSVVFWKDKDLSADVTVRPDGMISLPLLNEVRAAGLTPSQLKDRIAEEARNYVQDPTVTVEVKAINSRKVYITGGVRKAGPYPLSGSMRVLQLIAIAGGLDDYANRQKIVIYRSEDGRQVSFKFNYKEVLNQKHLEQNIELKPGDTVAVP